MQDTQLSGAPSSSASQTSEVEIIVLDDGALAQVVGAAGPGSNWSPMCAGPGSQW